MKSLFALAALVATPALATFETECLPDLPAEIAKLHEVPTSKVKMGRHKQVKDVSRPKLCGLRVIHEVSYSVTKPWESGEFKSNGYMLIMYSCGGCETIGEWQDIE